MSEEPPDNKDPLDYVSVPPKTVKTVSARFTEEPTYEESIILKWYRARKEYKENPWTYAREVAFNDAETLLAQIGMDLNTKDA